MSTTNLPSNTKNTNKNKREIRNLVVYLVQQSYYFNSESREHKEVLIVDWFKCSTLFEILITEKRKLAFHCLSIIVRILMNLV